MSRALRGAPTVKKLLKGILFRIWLLRTKFRIRRSISDPAEVCYIDPNRITRFVTVGKNIYKDTGCVLPGDWDLESRPITDKPEFDAFNERFVKRNKWNETEWYHLQTDKILAGKIRFGCSSVAEFDDRLVRVDELFHRIREDGYKTQNELAARGNNSLTGMDEVTIAIGRYGDPLFTEGRHRLAIAKILGLSTIPVKVTVRHKDWYELRKTIYEFYKNNHGKAYSPIAHFDFHSLPTLHGEKRYQLIKGALPCKTGSLLDIGAHLGYFCHRFEEEGFSCRAVESDIRTFYLLKKLRDTGRRKFQVSCISIFDMPLDREYDVVLALNIFYHFLKSRDTYGQLIKLLKRLRCRYMFFQPHRDDEHMRMKTYAYRTYSEKDFVNFVLEESNFNHSVLLGRDDDGRAVYMFS